MADKYDYDELFQKRIVCLCLRDPVFMRDFYDVVDYKYLESEYLQTILKTAIELNQKYKQIPTQTLLIEEIRETCKRHKIKSNIAEEYIDHVNDLYRIELRDKEAIKERVIRFGRRQALKLALLDCADQIEKDEEFDKVQESISSALRVGMNNGQLGSQFFGSIMDIPKDISESGIYSPATKIPTGITSLDQAQIGGNGPGRRQVWAVMAPPGAGKSQFLVNTGSVAIRMGVPTVHITIGDMDELDCRLRYAARLTMLSMWEVSKNSDQFLKRGPKYDLQLDKYLRIKYYSGHTITMATIEAYLSRLVTIDCIKPGLVIIDYPDELRPYTDNDYQNMGRIYSEIGRLADDFDCLVWVASQIRRGGPGGGATDPSAVYTLDNIADSWRKAAKADGVVSFNQNVYERRNGYARLFQAKGRRANQIDVIPTKVDFSRSYIKEISGQDLEEYQEGFNKFYNDKVRKGRN